MSAEVDLDRWDAWTPRQVAARLQGVEAPWCVAAGWALDLFMQDDGRPHEDLEIAVPAHAFDAVAQRLADCELFVVGSGRATPLREADTALLREHHQTWVRETAAGPWRVDILREPSAEGRWVARRDPRIRLDYDELIRSDPHGVPFACPEVVLLFKAKARRDKDEADFARVLPRLDDAAREWLREALALAHPDHEWIERLR